MKRQYVHREKRERILEKYDYICVYCLDEATCVDHIVPWSYSRNNSDDNLIAACNWCNQKLYNKVFSPTSISMALDKKQKYIRELLNQFGKRDPRSRCPDCHLYFRPLVDGATMLICPDCNKKTR
jgi:CRISPR/Cas system Type II protein with McrA/HNH and RuvC-like nuclease domain